MNIISAMGHGEMEEARHHWGWLLALGIFLVLLGAVAASTAYFTTVVTIVFFGAVLLVSGVAQIASAYRQPATSSFWLHLLAGVLDIVLGGLIIMRPLAGALVLTLVLAAFFFVEGIYRISGAISLRMASWPWILLSGLVDVGLAVLLFIGWPASGLWFIGFCIGIGLIFRGWAWVMFSLMARKAVPSNP